MELYLDDIIRDADAQRDAAQVEWQLKHQMVRIGSTVYWLPLEVPAEVAQVLDHLPKEREDQKEERLHQIKTRLSDDEQETFELLVKASGLPQGEYIRGMILNGHLEITQTSQVDTEALAELTQLSAELGRLAGMIRMTVISNKEPRILNSMDKAKLEAQMRELRQLQGWIQSLAEEIHGNLQTHSQ